MSEPEIFLKRFREEKLEQFSRVKMMSEPEIFQKRFREEISEQFSRVFR